MAIAAPFPTAAPVHVTRRAPHAGAARRRGSRPAGRTAPGQPGVRLTRRGRIVVGVLVSVPFAAILMVMGSLSADAGTAGPASGAGPVTGIVVVQPGESLWQIARQVAPQADPRATLTAIRELNGLGSDVVVPGQALVVPAGS